MDTITIPKLMTVDQLAELLQVPKGWIYKNRDLPKIKCGKYNRFDREKVLAYLEKQED